MDATPVAATGEPSRIEPTGKTYIPLAGKEVVMPTCSDCALYTKKTATGGECSINGPVPADRDAGRCPSRTFRPR